MSPLLFEYRGELYPDYLRRGNAMHHIQETAAHFCQGWGVDVGCGDWPLKNAIPVDKKTKWTPIYLPSGLDYVFSSHFLEHAVDPVQCLEHWLKKLKPGGCVFLNLPHPEMRYWRPQFCKKHLHLFWPRDMATMLEDLGYVDVIHSERDLMWSFQVVGFRPRKDAVSKPKAKAVGNHSRRG